MARIRERHRAAHNLAGRIRFLEAEALDHEKAIRALVRTWRPHLLEQTGVGPIVAATVLTAWFHPRPLPRQRRLRQARRHRSHPGVLGKTVRYRLNRSGDRQLNRALHTVVLSRLNRSGIDGGFRPPKDGSHGGTRGAPTPRASGSASTWGSCRTGCGTGSSRRGSMPASRRV